MTTRDELIDAGTAAICERYTPVAEPEERLREDVGVVLDAVEGLIRADERERLARFGYIFVGSAYVDSLAYLRAKVEALRDRPIASFDGYTGRDALDQVLALFDGGIA